MTRAEAEDFLFHEAALLDAWKLDEWLQLLTEDARYLVPSNDAHEGNPENTLHTIADDIHRIRGRVTRLKDPRAHAEFPHSRTRRMISNVRVLESVADIVRVEANFVVYRFRREERVSQYVGRYRYVLRLVEGRPRIALREALLDAHELASLGAVSFIL
jgi:p-cumate 2,3-dioxygenase subunit beta